MSQPSDGFRAGLDSVLLGAAVGRERERLLDMGSGVGTAAYIALSHNPAATAVLAEQNADMLILAQANADENGFSQRATIIHADVSAKGEARRAAGLTENGFDSVIANPPYFAEGTLAADGGRAHARHMDATMLDLWIRTAAGCCAAGGEVIFIYPAVSLPTLLNGFAQRFGSVTVLPLSPRSGQPASRVLIRGIKGSRAAMSLLSTRVLHEAEGRAFSPEFDAIFRGTARLCW